jgi:hypothetical protein
MVDQCPPTRASRLMRDLICALRNALLYNAEGTSVHQMAEEMMVWCEQQIGEMRNLQHHMSRS